MDAGGGKVRAKKRFNLLRFAVVLFVVDVAAADGYAAHLRSHVDNATV
jgi:hypothetical protein